MPNALGGAHLQQKPATGRTTAALTSVQKRTGAHYSRKWLRARANISLVVRPRLLSVAEAAAELNASRAYVRRMLARQRLYGIKLGSVWAIFPDDVEAFKRTRRPPGRPRKEPVAVPFTASAIAGERAHAGTHRLLRKRGRKAK
jgi:excisionase family DNA binding protein